MPSLPEKIAYSTLFAAIGFILWCLLLAGRHVIPMPLFVAMSAIAVVVTVGPLLSVWFE